MNYGKILACDFETTVYDGQESTEVWLAGSCELYTEKPAIQHSLPEFLEYLEDYQENVLAYFHNLKFDGAFLVDYFLRTGKKFRKCKKYELNTEEFSVVISEMGSWYTFSYKTKAGKIIEIRDSYKLLPYALKKIGKDFKTKHQKLEMEYIGYRYAGCDVTPEEIKYFEGDLYVLKEGLEHMYNEGHKELTIGSSCLKEFRSRYDKEDYAAFFPNLYELDLPEELKSLAVDNYGEYISKAYRGGWCYLKPGEENIIHKNGETYDVNSLYPSRMHSESGCRYPYGKPNYWVGEIPHQKLKNKEWFVTFSCRFKIKRRHLPTVQIKRNPLYRGNEYLETSDVRIGDKYSRWVTGYDGKKEDTRVTLTMTRMDYELFLSHYTTYEMTVLHGCYFFSDVGFFDDYLNKYREIKLNSVGAKREEAKLFSNNLYGKMASTPDSSYKEPYLDEFGNVKFHYHAESEKKPGYIAIGAYITSNARCFTINAAQANYDSFIYSDTDSLHTKKTLKNIPLDDKLYNHWAHESSWTQGKFVRQKTYIEVVDGEMNITCAGMSDRAKNNFKETHTIDDFAVGVSVPGNLKPKRITGGVVLVDTEYNMK